MGMASSSPPSSLVEDARVVFQAAVQRVQAPELFSISKPSDWGPESLDAYNAIRVVGMGKAALAMAGVVEQEVDTQLRDGCVVVPEGHPETYPEDVPVPSVVDVVEGGHPLPTQGSVRGARRILKQADATGTDELLLVLVSGGGTALSTLPAEGLELSDLKTTYHQMLTAGVDVHQMNTVRKHLTRVGGGQLARAASPAAVGSLIVSDVVGNDISVIASGPTVPDPTTYEEAMRVLYAHDLWQSVPAPIRTHLTEGARDGHPETPGPDTECFAQTNNTLLGTNRTALDAAQEAATARGYEVQRVSEGVEGEARSVGANHAETMLDADPSVPTCWLWGGETTVTVTGDGMGGRNQEVALGGALALQHADAPAVLLSGGTDGIDGPTDAAGAWATPSTATDARDAGCDPEAHLEANDAYPLFDAVDQLLHTGPTHTNVMDVHVGLVLPDV
ncbi:MAG: hydroxypyruvate reductase [Bacteroidetes bacterium QH_1_64_81]|nr:MAG: hydroxypyruvate reductase [Bacteroidetes bacterium QH_1_64_81]